MVNEESNPLLIAPRSKIAGITIHLYCKINEDLNKLRINYFVITYN